MIKTSRAQGELAGRDCGCKVELPEVRSMLWHMLNNPSPVRGMEVELALDAPAIALPAGTPWREATTSSAPSSLFGRREMLQGPRNQWRN